MQLIVTSVFVICAIAAIYPYVLYPWLLWFLCRKIKPHPPTTASNLPSFTVIIPCHDEEVVIKRKIENTLDCVSHTPGHSKIIVVSDGSTDKTCDIAKNFVPRIRLIELPTQSGILGAFRAAMREVTSEVVIFSDADIIVSRETFNCLLSHYYDPAVGGVCGHTAMYIQPGSGLGVEQLNVGLRTWVRYWQSLLHSSIGADGSNWSVRRELVAIPSRPVIGDDLVIPLEVIHQGYRYILDPSAKTTEISAPSIGHEYRRKIRTIAGGIEAGLYCRWMFSRKHMGTAFHYASWKLAKYLVPVWAMIAILCSLTLSSHSTFFRILSVAAGTAAVLVAAGGLVCAWAKEKSPKIFAGIWHGFLAATAPIFAVDYLMRRSASGTWAITPRIAIAPPDTGNVNVP